MSNEGRIVKGTTEAREGVTGHNVRYVLIGAELNSEIEHQTARDSTIGPEKPLGARGAVMADTVGPRQG